MQDFIEMDDQALEEAYMELCHEIRNLPGVFTVSNAEFSWEWSRLNNTIVVSSPSFNLHYSLKENGDIDHYSFPSDNGKNETDAQETIQTCQMYAYILSAEFRQKIGEDFQSKKPIMDAIWEKHHAIQDEKKRRQDEIRAAETAEMEKQHKGYEQPGQVWYALGSPATRYTIESVTEKSVLFTVWLWKENAWESDKTKRVMKSNLGYKEYLGLFPVGTDNLTGQIPEEPETKTYR
jgi:hypothetical protein